MSLFKLIRAFQKAKGRSPTPGELSQLKKQADATPQPSNVLPFQFKKGFGDEINEMIEKGDITIGTTPKTTKKKPMVDPKFEKAVKAQEERSESFAKFKERMDDKNKEGAFQIAFNRYKDVDKMAMPIGKVLSIYKNLAKYPKGRNVITQDIDDIQKGLMFSTMGNRSREALVKDLQDILYPKKQSNPFEEVEVSDQLEFNFDDLDPKGMAGGGPIDPIDPGYLGIPPEGLGTGSSRPGGSSYPSLDFYDALSRKKKKKKKKREDKATGGLAYMLGEGGPVMQGGGPNYLGKQPEVKVPKYWKSSPDHPDTELAYITEPEKEVLIALNMHGGLEDGKPNKGPNGIISLQGDLGGYDASPGGPNDPSGGENENFNVPDAVSGAGPISIESVDDNIDQFDDNRGFQPVRQNPFLSGLDIFARASIPGYNRLRTAQSIGTLADTVKDYLTTSGRTPPTSPPISYGDNEVGIVKPVKPVMPFIPKKTTEIETPTGGVEFLQRFVLPERFRLAEGGRIGFAVGGIDKARRAFLKLMGGVGAGIGGLKMGLFGGKKTSTAIKVAETVKKSDAKGMPEWFPKLVERVMKEGEDVTETYSTVERTIVKKAKLPESKTDIIVEVDLNTGDTLVDVGMGKHGWVDGHNGQPARIELRKGEVIEEGPARGKKEADEFGVEEQEYTGDGENVKYEDSSYNNYGEHGSDFSEVEKYATGKNTDEFNIKGTKKRESQQLAEGRAEMEAEQAFEEMDEFASGGLAKLLGE